MPQPKTVRSNNTVTNIRTFGPRINSVTAANGYL